MSEFQIFGLQWALSFVVVLLIARWYVVPHLARLPLRSALIPLVFTHCFRHLGLVVLVPSLVDPQLPPSWSVPLAYGDLAAQLLALCSVVALHRGSPRAYLLVWIFNLVGALDLAVAYAHGALLEVYRYRLGSAWYLTTFVGPVLVMTHLMIFQLLIRRGQEGHSS